MTTRMKLTIVLCAVVIGIIAVLLIKPPPLKVRHPVKIETRVFKVDAHLFSTNTVSSKVLSSRLGVDLTAPGRSIAFNDRMGLLFVKATPSELDTIERVVQVLNQAAPQIHIKARFIELPKAGFNPQLFSNTVAELFSNTVAGQMTGILNDSQFRVLLHAYEQRNGFKSLAEPEVTTLSGRLTQMKATDIVNVVTNYALAEMPSNSIGITPQTGQIETGPTVDIVPHVFDDGYTINLTAKAGLLEFIGYASPTNFTHFETNSSDRKIELPVVLAAAKLSRASGDLNLFDGQTLVLFPQPEQVSFSGQNPAWTERVAEFIRQADSKDGEKTLVVFITATIVDPAGNRVHSDDEMPFNPSTIPPQPR